MPPLPHKPAGLLHTSSIPLLEAFAPVLMGPGSTPKALRRQPRISERQEKPRRASQHGWEATTGWSEARQDALILTFTDTSRSESSTQRPSSALKRVASGRWSSPSIIGFWSTRYVSSMYQDCTAWTVVKVPVNGRSPAGKLARRDPQLLVTSAVANGAEAHSHVAPP
jgi:hypothetical protein